MAILQTDIVLADGDIYTVEPGEILSNVTVNAYGEFHIEADGAADNTTVSGGVLMVESDGTATEIVENGGYVDVDVDVEEGANVTFTPNTFSGFVLFYADATVHSGTTATDTSLEVYGFLHVSSGGTASSTTVNTFGELVIDSGGTASSTTVNDGRILVSRGGTVRTASRSRASPQNRSS